MRIHEVVHVDHSTHGRNPKSRGPQDRDHHAHSAEERLTFESIAYNYRLVEKCWWHPFEDLAQGHWMGSASDGAMTPGSAQRYARVFSSFVRYAVAHGLAGPLEVTPAFCGRYLVAPIRGHGAPSSSTSRFRLTVVRAAFQVLRVEVDCEDPTLGLTVATTSSPRAQSWPLTPAEAARLRTACRLQPGDTGRPAAVELGLYGLTHAEIAACSVGDFASGYGILRVGTQGSFRREIVISGPDRLVFVARGRAQRNLWRRRHSAWDPNFVPMVLARLLATYPAESIAPSVSSNLSRALQAAGITRPGVRPRSLREYAANRTYALTGRVEDVAAQLGLDSYDVAWRLICPQWQDTWAQTVRDAEH